MREGESEGEGEAIGQRDAWGEGSARRLLGTGLLAVLVGVVVGVVQLEERLRCDLAEEEDTYVVAQAAPNESA